MYLSSNLNKYISLQNLQNVSIQFGVYIGNEKLQQKNEKILEGNIVLIRISIFIKNRHPSGFCVLNWDSFIKIVNWNTYTTDTTTSTSRSDDLTLLLTFCYFVWKTYWLGNSSWHCFLRQCSFIYGSVLLCLPYIRTYLFTCRNFAKVLWSRISVENLDIN